MQKHYLLIFKAHFYSNLWLLWVIQFDLYMCFVGTRAWRCCTLFYNLESNTAIVFFKVIYTWFITGFLTDFSFVNSSYLFKVSNGNTRTMWVIFSNLTIKILEQRQWRRSGDSFVNFEQLSHTYFVFSIVDFEQINASFQLTFTCSKSAIETLEKVWNMSRVNNKSNRTMSLTSLWCFLLLF